MLTSNNTTEASEPMAEYKAGPRKRAPTHPGAIVKTTLERLHVSVRAAALAIGVTPAALHNIVDEKSAVSPEMAIRLGAYFGNGAEIWAGLQTDYDLWHARLAKPELMKIKTAEAAD